MYVTENVSFWEGVILFIFSCIRSFQNTFVKELNVEDFLGTRYKN